MQATQDELGIYEILGLNSVVVVEFGTSCTAFCNIELGRWANATTFH